MCLESCKSRLGASPCSTSNALTRSNKLIVLLLHPGDAKLPMITSLLFYASWTRRAQHRGEQIYMKPLLFRSLL